MFNCNAYDRIIRIENIQLMHSLTKNHLDQCNLKIIKLIRRKIYPSRHQNHKYLLPKIKSTESKNSVHKLNKQYVQIDLQEEQGQRVLSQQTDLQQQLKFNAYQERNTIKMKGITEHKPHYKSFHHFDYKKQQFQAESVDDEPKNECFLALRQKHLLKQYDNNINYLSLFKQQIKNKKRDYLQQIKLSESFVEQNKCNFQYLVSKMSTENEGKKTYPYEDISPNHISQYIEMLSSNPNIDSNQHPQLKLCNNDKKRSVKRKETLVLQFGKESTEGMSAKLRLKANHRKMIELIKN